MDAIQLAKYMQNHVFQIGTTGFKSFLSPYYVPPYVVKFFSIHYIVSGKSMYKMNDVHYEAEPGSVFIFTPNTQFEWGISGSESLQLYHIRFDFRGIVTRNDRVAVHTSDESEFCLFGKYTVADRSGIRHLFDRIYKLDGSQDIISHYEKKMMFDRLWLAMIKDFHEQEFPSTPAWVVDSVVQVIHQHYRDKLSVKDLAESAGLSFGYFNRLFKRYTGFSTKEYIIRIRINKAKEQLQHPYVNLTEIARNVGYEDPYYFSRIFKKWTGLSPSQYVSKNREWPGTIHP